MKKSERLLSLDVLRGTEQYIGSDWYAVLLTAANSLILFFILRVLYKQKMFLKV